MKKLLSTLLMSLLSAICVFAFTACSNTDNEAQEPKIINTVSAEEWKSAISTIFDGEHSVDGKYTIKVIEGGVEDGTEYFFQFDYSKKIARFYYVYGSDDINCYFWRGDNDKYYKMSYEFSDEEFKEEVDKSEFEEEINNYLISIACGGGLICGLVESYGAFSYDENGKEYKMSAVEDEEAVNYSLKFENGKLVKCVAVKGEAMTVTLDYKYELSLTVPQDILNMPVK